MSSSEAAAQVEMVYCHECNDRWRRDENGLVCPSCDSEFTEIVSSSTTAPDLDHINDSQIEESNEEELEEETQENSTFGNPGALLGSLLGMMPQGGTSPNMRSYRFQSGNGSASITFQSTTYSPGNGPGSTVNPTASPDDPLNLLVPLSTIALIPTDMLSPRALNQLFNGLGRRAPGFQEDGDGPNAPPFPLFNFILGGGMPGGSRPGDVAWTQEEFDRIISQLMDHSNTGAAGATEDAISSLPTVKVDKTMLGESNKAECTICMDEVELGEEVTRLYCKHWFHTPCISFWLKEHNTCPHCRKSIEDARKEAEDSGQIPKSTSTPQPSASSSSNTPQDYTSRTTPFGTHSTLRQTFEGNDSSTPSFQHPWSRPSPFGHTFPQSPFSPYESDYQRPNRDPMEETSSTRSRSSFSYPYPPPSPSDPYRPSPSAPPESNSRSGGMRRGSNSPPPLRSDSESGYLSRHHDTRHTSRTEDDGLNHRTWRERSTTAPRRRDRDSSGHILDEHGNRIPSRNIRSMHQRPGRPIPRDPSTLTGREVDREVMMQRMSEYDRLRQMETDRHSENLRRHSDRGERSSRGSREEEDRDGDRDGGPGGSNLFAAARRLFGGSGSGGASGSGEGGHR
jgi:E3 ubiquitin-protein ligase RNF115/126